MAHTFEIHKDKSGQFRVRFKYSGEVIFSTEAYTTKASAQKAIKSIKDNGPAAPVNDLTLAVKAPAKAAAKAPAKTPAKSSKPAATAAAKPLAPAKPAAKADGAAQNSPQKSTVKTSSRK